MKKNKFTSSSFKKILTLVVILNLSSAIANDEFFVGGEFDCTATNQGALKVKNTDNEVIFKLGKHTYQEPIKFGIHKYYLKGSNSYLRTNALRNTGGVANGGAIDRYENIAVSLFPSKEERVEFEKLNKDEVNSVIVTNARTIVYLLNGAKSFETTCTGEFF